MAPHRRNGQQGRPVRTPGHAPPPMHGQAPPSKQAHHMMASPTGPPHSRDDNGEGGKVNLGQYLVCVPLCGSMSIELILSVEINQHLLYYNSP